MSAKNSAKAALKGKNNLRKKKVRLTPMLTPFHKIYYWLISNNLKSRVNICWLLKFAKCLNLKLYSRTVSRFFSYLFQSLKSPV